MDKIDKLLDAIEHPDRYNDAEIEAMFRDPETKEILKLLDKTKSSLQPVTEPDVDAEWEAFSNNHIKRNNRPRYKILNLMSRNVAASIAIGVASFAAVAAVVGASVNYLSKQETPATEIETVAIKSNVAPDSVNEAENIIVAVSPETIIFDNEPLTLIVSKIAEYYGYQTSFNSDAAKSLRLYFRWDQALTIDEVVENLNNFEQIHLSLEAQTIKID